MNFDFAQRQREQATKTKIVNVFESFAAKKVKPHTIKWNLRWRQPNAFSLSLSHRLSPFTKLECKCYFRHECNNVVGFLYPIITYSIHSMTRYTSDAFFRLSKSIFKARKKHCAALAQCMHNLRAFFHITGIGTKPLPMKRMWVTLSVSTAAIYKHQQNTKIFHR